MGGASSASRCACSCHERKPQLYFASVDVERCYDHIRPQGLLTLLRGACARPGRKVIMVIRLRRPTPPLLTQPHQTGALRHERYHIRRCAVSHPFRSRHALYTEHRREAYPEVHFSYYAFIIHVSVVEGWITMGRRPTDRPTDTCLPVHSPTHPTQRPPIVLAGRAGGGPSPRWPPRWRSATRAPSLPTPWCRRASPGPRRWPCWRSTCCATLSTSPGRSAEEEKKGRDGCTCVHNAHPVPERPALP